MKNKIDELVNKLENVPFGQHNGTDDYHMQVPDGLMKKAIEILKSLAPSDNAELLEEYDNYKAEYGHHAKEVGWSVAQRLLHAAIAALSKMQPDKFDVREALVNGAEVISGDGHRFKGNSTIKRFDGRDWVAGQDIDTMFIDRWIHDGLKPYTPEPENADGWYRVKEMIHPVYMQGGEWVTHPNGEQYSQSSKPWTVTGMLIEQPK